MHTTPPTELDPRTDPRTARRVAEIAASYINETADRLALRGFTLGADVGALYTLAAAELRRIAAETYPPQ